MSRWKDYEKTAHLGTCPEHDKRLYMSRKQARQAAKALSHVRVAAYPCTVRTGMWHLGHIAPEIKSGEVSRGEAPWKLRVVRMRKYEEEHVALVDSSPVPDSFDVTDGILHDHDILGSDAGDQSRPCDQGG